MKIEEFEKAIQEDDFAVGDSFWLGDWEFEVVNYRINSKVLCEDKVVFKWQLTREDFIQLIADNHPEIDNAEAFFEEHKDKIAHHFAEGFNALICECGATYGTIMNDAIDEVIQEYQRNELDGCMLIKRADKNEC